MRTFASIVAAIALCTGIAAAGAVLTRADVAPYLHPQQMVDVGGHKLNLYCTGQGSPTVVLDAGEGETMFTWRKVQPKVAKFSRVCSFDRAGMGFSEGGPLPRDASAMVDDLHALLKNAGLQAPYILVGHSIAGLYVPLYADRYPHDVAGMVLIDPSFPNQDQVLEAASPTMKRFAAEAPNAYHVCYEAALHGDLTAGSDKYAICGFPAHAAALVNAQCRREGPASCELIRIEVAQLRRPAFWLDLGSEDAASGAKDSGEDIKEQGSYGAVPLIVLTAANDTGGASPIPPGEMRAIESVWTAGHDRLARLSSVGVNFVISHTGHLIQDDRPNIVVSAIAEVVSQVNGGR
ncbi:MAG TPA: alpha/beta hydrolase [Candidatus Baltobacteraceae bacterium]|nr:alpha/beta hydrolase [Candidatus Baltobacteraceae bacterium]